MGLVLLFGLILPAMGFFSGAYLLYRAVARLNQEPKPVLGHVGPKNSFLSPISKQKCVYSKMIVEYYTGGHNPWKPFYAREERRSFDLGNKTIDSRYADIRISAPISSFGYICRDDKFLVRLGAVLNIRPPNLDSVLRPLRDVVDVTQEISANEFIDNTVLLAALEDKMLREKIKPHIKKPLRISEYLIPVGSTICVVSDPAGVSFQVPPAAGKNTNTEATISGTLESPLLVLDSDVQVARSILREKTIFSAACGSFLVLLAACLTCFILASL